MKYIDSEKLIAEIKRQIESAAQKTDIFYSVDDVENEKKYDDERNVLERLLKLVTSLQQEQPNNMIQWTGHNLKEVIDFTGKSPKFGEWFKSWDELESYVHSHGDILKLFSDDGSHFEVPVGAWIVKTPDGYNVPSVARFIHAKQEQPQFPGIEDPGIPGKDFIPVEWVDACEMYGKWKIVKLDQPEVNLAEEITRFFSKNPIPYEHITDWPLLKNTAIHFYELGLNARKKQPEDVVVIAKTFLDALSKTPYNNKPITDAQIIVRQLLLFFENPKEYNPDAILKQPKEDLENYLENYFKEWHIEEEIGLTKPDGWSCIVDDLKSIARHFAEWGAIHLNAKKE